MTLLLSLAWLACQPLPCALVCDDDPACEAACELSDPDFDARECSLDTTTPERNVP